jgi:hypothetical protein
MVCFRYIIVNTLHKGDDNEEYNNTTTKPFNKVTTKDSYTWNIKHNKESIAV